jgi:crossover junction endodeoxyribonuclease RuvC
VRHGRGGNHDAVEFGVLCTPPTDELPSRLASMNAQLRALIARLGPDVVVVERVFFQTNARTAMGVGQASGLALAAAFDAGCGVEQYTSNEVKQGITGFGAADKAQMQRMVQRILRLAELPRPADAADALGLALHHLAIAPFAMLSHSSIGAAAARELGGASGDRVRGGNGGSGLGNARVATSFGGVRVVQGRATVEGDVR